LICAYAEEAHRSAYASDGFARPISNRAAVGMIAMRIMRFEMRMIARQPRIRRFCPPYLGDALYSHAVDQGLHFLLGLPDADQKHKCKQHELEMTVRAPRACRDGAFAPVGWGAMVGA